MEPYSDSSFVLDPDAVQPPEQRLADAEKKFSALFEKGPIGVAFHVMIRNEDGKAIDYKFLDANLTYQKLTGVDPRGLTVLQAFPGIENDPFDWIGTFGHVALTGEEIRFESYLAPNDRWYDVVGYQYKPDHFVAAFLEITERKRAEAQLRDSNERLRLATQAGGVGIWDWDVVNDILIWDEQVSRLYGLPLDKNASVYEAWCNILLPEDREVSDKAIQDALIGAKEFNVEYRVVWPNGEVRTLKGNASVYRDDTGNPVRMIGTNWDITESREHARELARYRDHLEERIQERTEELEAANRELEAFSFTVSHDLRAPLRHIDGYVDILTEDHKDEFGADARNAMRVISSSVRNMNQLIDDLLDLARTSRQPLQRGPVSMDEVLKQALRHVRKSCAECCVEWVVSPLPNVTGDSGLLGQVWINLLENAVKYSRPRERARIEIGSTQTGSETIFQVRDNGVGFDMKYAHKLFGVFQRLHHQSEFEGTGIGLATVQRIVTRHKGRVWAESVLGEGAAFTFSLPRVGESG